MDDKQTIWMTKANSVDEAMFYTIVQTVQKFAEILEKNDETTINMKQYFSDMCFMLKYVKYLQDHIEGVGNETHDS